MRSLLYLKRLFDSRPVSCDLCVTDRHGPRLVCRSQDMRVHRDPDAKDLMRWCRKARDLGCLHINLQGGEPLLHPSIVDIVAFCRKLGMTVSLSTDGLPLDEGLIGKLDRAGLNCIRLSIDRMPTLSEGSRPLARLESRLDLLRLASFTVIVTGTLSADTLPNCDEVMDGTLSRGWPVHFRLAHPDRRPAAPARDRARIAGFLDETMLRKAGRQKVHTPWAILDYQQRLLSGDLPDWTCAAGFKHFTVSSRGEFWPCPTVRTRTSIEDISVPQLAAWYRKKPCQAACDVYDVVAASMRYRRPVRFLLGELGLGLRRRVQWNPPVFPNQAAEGGAASHHEIADAPAPASPGLQTAASPRASA